MRGFQLRHLPSALPHVARFPEGRALLLDPESRFIPHLLPQLASKQVERRRSIATMLKNICMDKRDKEKAHLKALLKEGGAALLPAMAVKPARASASSDELDRDRGGRGVALLSPTGGRKLAAPPPAPLTSLALRRRPRGVPPACGGDRGAHGEDDDTGGGCASSSSSESPFNPSPTPYSSPLPPLSPSKP